MRAVFESAFDVVYLVLVVTLGILMLRKADGRKQYTLFGIMAVVLGAGEASPLFVISKCPGSIRNHHAWRSRPPAGRNAPRKVVYSCALTKFGIFHPFSPR